MFQATSNRLMAVSYSSKGDSFTAGKAWIWTEAQVGRTVISSFDLAPDGRRLAVIV